MPGFIQGMMAARGAADLGTARGSITIDLSDLDQIVIKVRHVGQTVKRELGRSFLEFDKLAKGIKSVRTELVALSVGAGLLVGFGLGAALDVRKYRVAFTQLLGDEERAIKLMERLAETASEFGLEIQGVWQLGRALLPILKEGEEALDGWVRRAARLASTNPLRTAADATRAIQEFIADQPRSLKFIFNVPPDMIKEAERQFTDLAEQFDYILDKMGATEEGALAMADAWISVKNELKLVAAVGFRPLFESLQSGLRYIREWLQYLRATSPELLNFGAGIAAIAVVGAPTLLFLERMITLTQKLREMGVLGALGRGGILVGAAAAGGVAGLGLGKAIGRATGDEQAAGATWATVWKSVRQLLFIIAYAAEELRNIIANLIVKSLLDFADGLAKALNALGGWLEGLSILVPKWLGGGEISDWGRDLQKVAAATLETSEKARKSWATWSQQARLDLLDLIHRILGFGELQKGRDLIGAPAEATKVRPRFTEKQLEKIYEWGQAIRELEEEAGRRRLEITEQFESQRAEILASYGRTIAREAEDWARQRARAERQLQLSIASIRLNLDRQETKWRQQLARKIAQMQKESGRRTERLQEDHNINMERLQRRHRLTLMEAAARLDARAVAEEQRRYREQVSEAEQDLRKRVDLERENLAERIAQAQGAHAQRIQDARAAAELRIQDVRKQHAAQRRLEEEDRALRLQRMEEDHQLRLTAMELAYEKQLTELEQHIKRERTAIHNSYSRQLTELGAFMGAWERAQHWQQQQSLRQFDAYWAEVQAIANRAIKHLIRLPFGVTLPTLDSKQQGGPVTKTGPYTLHGTRARPEYVLSAATVDSLRRAIGGSFSQSQLVGAVAGGRSVSIGQINIPIHAAPGMDVEAVGAEVQNRLEKFFCNLLGR